MMKRYTSELNYFRLYPDVIFQESLGNKSKLLLLADEIVLELGCKTSEIINLCETNTPIKDIVSKLDLDTEEIYSFLEMLHFKGVGDFAKSPCFIEKVRIPDPLSNASDFLAPLTLSQLRISLVGDCSPRCNNCETRLRRKTILPCQSCFGAYNTNNKSLTFEQVERVLVEARVLDCLKLELIVGRSVESEEILVKAVDLALKKGYTQIQIFTGTPFSPFVLSNLKSEKINIIFQLLYTSESTYDLGLNQAGQWESLKHNTEYLKKHKMNYSFYYINNPKLNDSNMDQILSLSPDKVLVDKYYQEDIDRLECQSKKESLTKPGLLDYISWLDDSSCYNSVLTLLPSGKYSFCPLQENDEYGHVDEKRLVDVLSKKRMSNTDLVRKRMECINCSYDISCKGCKIESLQ